MAETPSFSTLALFRIDGDVALITGGGGGLGRIASLALAEAGAHVCVADIDADAAQAVVGEITAAGGGGDAWTLDVMDNDRIVAVIGEIAARHGRIDVLVNNAGTARREPTADMTLEVWNLIMQMNQTQIFVCSREAGRHMIRQGSGRIINIASIMGLVGGGFYPNFPYHATKGAVVNMTRALAAEWASHGIRVNAIAPTFVVTDLTAKVRAEPEKMRIIEDRTPMGRFAQPEEMAGGILYLASPASAMVTGHTLVIDGGWTAI
ncbi:MAG: SDR family oxidoreductase [Alphaproteobacteria bacterium]|nr:SDR family oxidoreductase [Alphaproteobacteria bacterium]MDP6515301.1 SDR family oxidoreductase [Alphaproteobacteria bacterium]